MFNVREDQRGAVALITVVFFALILTIVTTSFITITINEQRQATDDDLTKRAFFAAESGVEDAKIAIDRYLAGDISEAELNGDQCQESVDLVPEIENTDGITASYSCQLISLIAPSFEATLEPWGSTLIPLRAVDAIGDPTTFSSMTIRWHEFNADGAFSSRTPGTDTDYPDANGWTDGTNPHPALIRLQIVSYPTNSPGGTFDITDVENLVVFVNPSGPGVNPDINITGPIDGTLLDGGSCPPTANSGYVCDLTLTGFDDADRNYAVRVSALYAQSNIQVVLNDGAVDLEGAQAIIDVTGQAGDVFRRVETRVALGGRDYLPNAVLTSANTICKEFNITDVTVDPLGREGFVNVNPGEFDPTDTLNEPAGLNGENILCHD